MAAWNVIPEYRRLCQESAKIRADSIRIRILSGHTFCAVAESRLRYASWSGAQDMLAVIRERVSEIDFHLREPGHVLPADADRLRRLLIQLEERIQGIEKSMESSGAPAKSRVDRDDSSGTARHH
jgi:hypothetical protein